MGIVGLAVAAIFFPITAGLTAIILLIDDFLAYMRGEDSLLGRFIEAMSGGFKIIKEVAADLFDYLEEKILKFGWLKDIGQFVGKIFQNPYMAQMQPQSQQSGQQGFVPYGQNFAQGGQNTVNNNITISVPGVSDPEAFAKQVSDALKRQNTDGYFQNGGTGR